MNILISTGGVMLATTILWFSYFEQSEPNTLAEAYEAPTERIESSEVPETEPQSEPQPNLVIEESNESTETVLVETEEEKEVEVEEAVVEEDRESSSEEIQSTLLVDTSTTRIGLANPSPAIKASPTINDQNKTQVKPEFKEHLIVLESKKGRSSAKQFSKYLADNLLQLKHEFTSSASENKIKKFTLKLDNGYEANFRMQVAGFEKLELHWETNDEGEIREMWYRLDAKEIKELDFSKSVKSSVKVKHTHQEF